MFHFGHQKVSRSYNPSLHINVPSYCLLVSVIPYKEYMRGAFVTWKIHLTIFQVSSSTLPAHGIFHCCSLAV